MQATLTTTSNHDADLAAAEAQLRARIDFDGHDGDNGKNALDALNNTWVEGITVGEWVERAADLVGV